MRFVRVQGISRKGKIDFSQLSEETSIRLNENEELALAKHLMQLQDTLTAVAGELMPNRLCQYLFELSQKFNQFYECCPVVDG